MFEVLSSRFSKIFSNLSKKRNLNENNIADALSDIKKALLASEAAIQEIPAPGKQILEVEANS